MNGLQDDEKLAIERDVVAIGFLADCKNVVKSLHRHWPQHLTNTV